MLIYNARKPITVRFQLVDCCGNYLRILQCIAEVTFENTPCVNFKLKSCHLAEKKAYINFMHKLLTL